MIKIKNETFYLDDVLMYREVKYGVRIYFRNNSWFDIQCSNFEQKQIIKFLDSQLVTTRLFC